MAVTVKIMDSDEFQQYLDYAIENFANEQIKSGNWKQADAINKAKEEHKRLLPDGPNTENNYLFTIRDENLKVGMVWLKKWMIRVSFMILTFGKAIKVKVMENKQ